jgi:hypothetical protein
MSQPHTGNVQPAIDNEEHIHPFGLGAFGAKMVMEPMPPASYTQKVLDYGGRTDSNPVYVGFNFRGAATSDVNWVLQKLTYDASDRVVLVQIAIDSWDNHDTTAVYT